LFPWPAVIFILAILVIFVVSGCGTAKKKPNLAEEVTGVKARVDTLETKVEGVETKQAEVERVTSEQAQAIEGLKAKHEKAETTNISVKPRFGKSGAHTKEIQMCLKNAGFYNGKIDGVKGKNTRKAVKEFQKANGLSADSVVGKKTWEALSKYAGAGAGAGPQTSGGEEAATK